jgi:hypothetical protein
LYSQLEFEGAHPGWTHGGTGNNTSAGWRNGQRASGKAFTFMLCPSSPLPKMADTGSHVTAIPHYVGIGGAANGDSRADLIPQGFVEDAFRNGGNHPQKNRTGCCGNNTNGRIAHGGMLVGTETKAIRDATDGTTNVMLVGEASDFGRDANGNPVNIQGTHGWLMGSPRREVQPSAERMFNLTFINYPINFVKRPGNGNLGSAGIGPNFGSNNGLYSAHTGGCQVTLCDGSVRFVSENMNMETLRRLATRDDGQPLGEY